MIVKAAALSLSAPNEIKTIVPISSNGPQPPEVDGTIPLKLAKTPKKTKLEQQRQSKNKKKTKQKQHSFSLVLS